MRRTIFVLAVSFACGCHASGTVGAAASTGTGTTAGSGSTTASNTTTGSPLTTCGDCSDDSICQSGICVQLGGDGSCLPACAGGCAAGSFCQVVGDINGKEQSACVPQSGACGDPSIGPCPQGCSDNTYCNLTSRSCVPISGSGTTTGPSTTTTTTTTTGTSGTSAGGNCGSYAGPNTLASCTSCYADAGDCQLNGCYQGWYCDTQTKRCASPQTACGNTTSTTGTTGNTGTTGTTGNTGTTGATGTSAGAPWTGSVTKTGGSVNRLYFAAVGDCRPPNEDDTTDYPTTVIQKIFSDMNSLPVKPQFVVATGDYMYANPKKSQGAAQIQKFISAESAFPGVVFAAMGNHECTGYTDSNCGSGTSDGITNNYTDFMNSMMTPLGQSKPYYRFDVNDSAGQWTAKFIVLAMNAWNSTQASWLTTQMQQPTTYTFIIRHEPAEANTAPGVTPSENIINAYPYTMKIVGHTHEFYHQSGSREVIVGNGGAPSSGSYSYGYGYALIQMRSDGNIQIDNYNYSSNAPVETVLIPK